MPDREVQKSLVTQTREIMSAQGLDLNRLLALYPCQVLSEFQNVTEH